MNLKLKIMKKIFLLFLMSLIYNSIFCQENSKKEVEKENLVLKLNDTNCKNNKDLTIKTFRIKKGWGFDILLNNKNYIHQSNIPAINGEKPFKTKKEALKIAELMKSKICNNIIPPTITIQEINSLTSKK